MVIFLLIEHDKHHLVYWYYPENHLTKLGVTPSYISQLISMLKQELRITKGVSKNGSKI